MKLIKYCIPLLILFSILLLNEYMFVHEGMMGIPGTPKFSLLPETGSATWTKYWLKFEGLMTSFKAMKKKTN